MNHFKYFGILLLLIGATTVKAQTTTTTTSTDNVLKAYLSIKDALVADDSKLANQKAKEFTAALKEASSNQLDDKQKSTWLAYGEKLRFDGEHIGASTSIDHQREHFGSLSKNMYAVIKALKANSMAVYQQYCPMKKQSWLSETETIKNPYYGKEMSDCGVTKETLKANGGK